MMVQIPQVLDLDQVAECRKHLDAAEWVDGRVTAGPQSAQVKNNKQIPESHPVARQIGDAILSILNNHPLFVSAALPKRIFPPLFNSYSGGHSFGSHVDNSIRQIPGTQERIRTDLSATLFLCNPEDYDGGELVIQDTYGSHSVKLGAGEVQLKPPAAPTPPAEQSLFPVSTE